VKLRFRNGDRLTPDEFLHLLFLRPASSQQSRPSSRKTHQGKHHNGHTFHRSSSYLSDNLSGSGDLNELSDTVPFNSLPYQRRQYVRTAPEVFGQDRHWHRSSPSRGSSPKIYDSMHIGSANTSNHLDQDTQQQQQHSKILPQVLALSGLENTTVSLQRSLWKLLTENEFALQEKSNGPSTIWRLPDDFLVICVCPLGDTRERPPLHKSLVRFHAVQRFKVTLIDGFTS
jgi:hypothetical protein